MAYAPARSCNDELRNGATDGGCWKSKPDRGGRITSASNQYQVGPGSITEPMRGVIGPRGEIRDCV